MRLLCETPQISRAPVFVLGLALALFVSVVSTAAGTSTTMRFRTKTGVRVILDQNTESSNIALAVAVGTASAEADALPGTGALVASALFGSNRNLSREGVARALYFAGSDLRTYWTPEHLSITCLTTPEAFSRAVYVMAQALKNTDLDEETLAAARREHERDILRDVKDPVSAGALAIRSHLFQGHPYGRPPSGTPSLLRRITRRHAQTFYERSFTPEQTVLAVSGNLDLDYVRRVMENNFVDYEARRTRPRSAGDGMVVPEPHAPQRIVVTTAAPTAAIVVGYRTPGRLDPDYPTVRVLATCLGEGKGSRLYRAMREWRGVGYRVGTELYAFAHAGVLYAYAELDAARGKEALQEVEQELIKTVEGVLSAPPSESEVLRARQLAAGLHRQARQRAADRARGLAEAELLLGRWEADGELRERLEAVSPEDVRALAERVFRDPCVAVVAPAAP